MRTLASSQRRQAALLAANLFLLLAAYYLLKTVRESLILAQNGAETKSYSAAAQVLVLLLAAPAYSACASRLRRGALLNRITCGCAAALLVFAALDRARLRIGFAFFVWLGVSSVMLIAQAWACASDLFSEDQGRRVFPALGLAAALGALAGASAAGPLLRRCGTPRMFLLGAAALLLTAALNSAIDRGARSTDAACAVRPLVSAGGFALVLRSPYLRLIAALTILINAANATGEFLLGKMVVQHADGFIAAHGLPAAIKPQLIGCFYGSYFAWANLAGLALQAFFVARLLRRMGTSRALFIAPAVAAAGYAALAALPALPLARLTKICENSLDYSLETTAHHALFLRASRAAKYKAKTVIDTFYYRAGDLLHALLVLAGTRLAFTIRQYAVLNVALALLSLSLIAVIDRHYRRQGDCL